MLGCAYGFWWCAFIVVLGVALQNGVCLSMAGRLPMTFAQGTSAYSKVDVAYAPKFVHEWLHSSFAFC